MNQIYTSGSVDVDAIALGIVKVFPTLNLFEQRLSLELYLLLSGGQPVARAVLAERIQASAEVVDRILEWPGVLGFRATDRRLLGSLYRGSFQESSSVDGRWPKALGMVRVGHALFARIARQACRGRIQKPRW